MRVKLKSTGQTGTLTNDAEFDPNIYDRVDMPAASSTSANNAGISVNNAVSPAPVNKYKTQKSGIGILDAFSNFGANVAQNYEDITKGIAGLPKYVAGNIKEKGLVGGTAKTAKDMIGGTIDEYGNLISNPVKAVTEKPVSTFLDLLPLVSWAKGYALSKTPAAGEVATTTTKIKPFKGYKPEIDELAKEKGIDVPVSATTSNRLVKSGEALTQKGFFGQKIAKQADDALDSISKQKDSLISTIDKTDDYKAVGDTVKKGFSQFEDDFYKQKAKLYGQVDETKFESPAQVDNLKSTLEDIIGQKNESLAKDPNASYYMDIYTEIADDGTGINTIAPPTIKSLQQTLREIGNKRGSINDPLATGDKANLNRLYAALSKDIDESIKTVDPDIAGKLDKANSYYAETINKINSSLGEKISNADPEKLVDELIKPNSQTAIQQVKEITGPEGTQALQKSFFGKLLKESIGKENHIDYSKLVSNYNRYTEPTIRALLTDNQFQNLQYIMNEVRKYDMLEKAVKVGQKTAEGSQTAYLSKIGGLSALIAAKPAAAVGLLMSDYLLSKFFQSDMGKKLMTTGVDVTLPKASTLAPSATTLAPGISVGAAVGNKPNTTASTPTPTQPVEATQTKETPVTTNQTPQTSTEEPYIEYGGDKWTWNDLQYSKSVDPKNTSFYDDLQKKLETDIKDKQKNQSTMAGPALKNVDLVQNLYNKLDSTGKTGFLSGKATNLAAKYKTDPDAVLYKDTLLGVITVIARAMGEKGPISDKDIPRYRFLFPALDEPKSSATKKFENLRYMLNNINNLSGMDQQGISTNLIQ